jgi:hypothetical protein
MAARELFRNIALKPFLRKLPKPSAEPVVDVSSIVSSSAAVATVDVEASLIAVVLFVEIVFLAEESSMTGVSTSSARGRMGMLEERSPPSMSVSVTLLIPLLIVLILRE